jgi:hypothetical protein
MLKKLVFAILVFTAFYGCKRNTIFSGKAELRFSTDTVFFDTVFTTVGSLTERLKIINPYNEAVLINRVYLAEGQGSNFKLNVDGIQGNEVKDIRLEANDSIFVFVEVTVDPNGGNTPLVVEELLKVQTDENDQSVALVAWGQDAYFFPSVAFTDGEIFQLPVDKPVVFYGYSIVDTNSTLIIPAGARIHFHANGGLIVGHQASLKILGTVEDPVIIQGDRLEDFFEDVPGQWLQILLSQTSIDNEVRNALIKNGQLGIRVDSNSNANPSLILENTQILNMSYIGLLGQGARIVATNTIVGNCGDYTVALNVGGDYTFKHCTLGNVWSEGQNPRSKPTLFMTNYFTDAAKTIYDRPFSASFENTIVYGTLDDEVEFDFAPNTTYSFGFENCAVKTDLNADSLGFVNCIVNPGVPSGATNALFVSPGTNDYHLVAGSQAIDAGIDLGIPNDLEGNPRDVLPDIGALEYKEE